MGERKTRVEERDGEKEEDGGDYGAEIGAVRGPPPGSQHCLFKSAGEMSAENISVEVGK